MILTSLLLLVLQDPEPLAGLEKSLARLEGAETHQVLLAADEFELPRDDQWRVPVYQQLDAVQKAGGTPAANEMLFLARLLANGDSPMGASALISLLDQGGASALAAASSLSHPAFDLDTPTQDALGEWLATRRVDDLPEIYLEAAVTLHRIGDGPHRRAAKQYLRNSLTTPSEETYSLAALSLARTGEREDAAVRREVQRLAAGFGPNAVLAQSLLDHWRELDRERRKRTALRNAQRNNPSPAEGADLPEGFEVLDEVLRTIEARHMEGQKFTRDELIEAAADGMLRRLDVHSSFFAGPDYGEFIFDLNPEYAGIGAFVNTVDEIFTIIRPIYSGPAYESGLRSDDKILEVDGWSTINQPNDEIIKRLKGMPGTPVKVLVMRRGFSEPREFEVTRRKIDLPTLQTEELPGGILYMELVNFSFDCADQIRDTILGAQREGWLKGVVLDLRNNPGGYLNQAVDICDVFLPPRKSVVINKSRMSNDTTLYTRRPAAVPSDIPLAIVVNRNSASASEIVSGVLAQYGRAETFGERTFGKGSVQNLIPLLSKADEPYQDKNRNQMMDRQWEEYTDRNGNGEFDYGPRMRMTVAYYYLPDGSSIHTQRDHDGRLIEKGGVQPNMNVEFPDFELWKIREITRLLEEERFQDFARSLNESDPELAIELAKYDGADPQSYPGWDEWFASLETDLEPNDVRQFVRLHLRRVVSDVRGRVFAGNGLLGDYVEDPQLQEAIRWVLDPNGANLPLAAEYAKVFPETAQVTLAEDLAVEEEAKPY